MASMRDIKRRRASVQSTGQITKAMKLVATVKLQKAKNRALQSKEYFNCMYKTVISLLAKSANTNNIYTKESESKRKAIVVITSNRGLAGGYNSNVVKLITQNEELIKEDLDIYAIGKKGQEFLARKTVQNSWKSSLMQMQLSFVINSLLPTRTARWEKYILLTPILRIP